jgi:hypothetical protein
MEEAQSTMQAWRATSSDSGSARLRMTLPNDDWKRRKAREIVIGLKLKKKKRNDDIDS